MTQNGFMPADWVLCCGATIYCVAVININLRGILWNVNLPDFRHGAQINSKGCTTGFVAFGYDCSQNLLLRISAFFNSLAVLAILSRELNR